MIRDSTVTLTVSGGPGQTSVPNITGSKLADAKTTLKAKHLTLGTQTQQASDTVPKGSIISQNPPPGALVPRGSTVDVVVSSGLSTITVPSVVGKSQTDAVRILHGAGLHVSINQQPSDTVPKNQVISQDPAAGSDASKETPSPSWCRKAPNPSRCPT